MSESSNGWIGWVGFLVVVLGLNGLSYLFNRGWYFY